MFYDANEICVCAKCGYSDIAENLYMDPHLLCVRCPNCNSLMSVDEKETCKQQNDSSSKIQK